MFVSRILRDAHKLGRTADFALVKADKKANYSNDDEEEPNEVKFLQMLL